MGGIVSYVTRMGRPVDEEMTMQVIDATLRTLGLSVDWSAGNEGETVSRRPLPRADARRAVEALSAVGIEASEAPDHDDRGLSWLYVTANDA